MNGYQGYMPPPLPPQKRMRHFSFADIAAEGWGRSYEIDANGRRIGSPSDADISMGATLLVAQQLNSLYRLADALLSEVRGCRRDAKPATPKPPAVEPPGEAKRRRERESRRRAMEAYVRAGGVGTDDDGDGPEPVDVPAGVPPLLDWGFTGRVRRVLLWRLKLTTAAELVAKTADDLMCCKNFGATSLAEVREKLKGYGLRLAGDPA